MKTAAAALLSEESDESRPPSDRNAATGLSMCAFVVVLIRSEASWEWRGDN